MDTTSPNQTLKRLDNWGCFFIFLVLLSGIAFALLFPALQSAREAARRMQCSCRCLTLAFHNYHDVNGSFPPAYTVDENGNPLHSWRVLLLPYMEQKELYDKIRLDEPWNSPHNSQFHKQTPQCYACPSRPEKERLDGLATYQMVVGPDTISVGPNSTKLSDISHHHETFLVVEASIAVPWMSPQDLPQSALANGIVSSRPKRGKPVVEGIGSPHPGGAIVGWIDGSKTFLSQDTPPEILLEYSRIKPHIKPLEKEDNEE